MISKSYEKPPMSGDSRRDAGIAAESQMAHYLNRAFASSRDIHVLNNIRVVDERQPEQNGKPGTAQIDHLVVHRHGMLIVESKSINGTVTIRADGSGGDEWSCEVKSGTFGIASPIQQAQRQANFLRTLLQSDRERLMRKAGGLTGAAMKILSGTSQRGFSTMPIQIIVAIADRGRINKVGGWTEPTDPFQTFVVKADNVPSKIEQEFAKHKTGGELMSPIQGEYGIWMMKPDELQAVVNFLVSSDQPRSPRKKPKPPPRSEDKSIQDQNCKSCGGTALTARSGKFGYYWKCTDCDTNTTMPTVCDTCGVRGSRGEQVRIRKQGPNYFRCCVPCDTEVCIWTEDPA